ncbi:MAG: biotin--[acetyl-CoA-carboxylase] ligase [Pseudonocardiaceae bacterium]|nr:biotin--[acetyl-CoA-carboxylase] ligase [Pseudonocardiaceae bacterium]
MDAGALRARLAPVYPRLDVVRSTGSTNADLRDAASGDAPDRTLLIAGEQTAGVGRRSRGWMSPAGGLYLSVLLRPSDVPAAQLGSVAVIAGLALLRTVRALGVDAVLKWPNDLLAGTARAKCAGILCEAVPTPEMSVIVGIGLNTAPLGAAVAGPGGLPATSLAEHGVTASRTEIAAELLTAFAGLEAPWRAARGDLAAGGVLASYRDACDTIGRDIRIEGVGETVYHGRAVDVDTSGSLILQSSDGRRQAFSAGDVVHLRSTME